MIKLTTQQEPGQDVLRLDGSLGAETVDELRRFLLAKNGEVLMLDLGGLTSLDGEGRSLLLGLRDAGHRLRGGSLYIRRLLEEAQP